MGGYTTLELEAIAADGQYSVYIRSSATESLVERAERQPTQREHIIALMRTLLRALYRYSAALEAHRQAYVLNPNDAEIALTRAMSEHDFSDRAVAKEMYEQVLALELKGKGTWGIVRSDAWPHRSCPCENGGCPLPTLSNWAVTIPVGLRIGRKGLAMSGLPQLTEADVRRWIGDESFRRGQRYFDQDAILNPRRAGMILKAQCQGSRSQPYRVQITLGPKGIVSGDCSCPVGGGGHCKHAAALLLTWLDDADAFVDVEDMATTLDRRSKSELIDLIGKMVERYPDLEMLVELPVPGEAASKPMDAESIRRQVRRVFSSTGYEWGAVSDVAIDLGNVVDVGDGYVEREEWRNAAVVYETIICEVLDQYPSMHDEEGDLHQIVNRCVAGLGECLSVADDPAQRETILRVLFDTYAWDVNFGGIDMGYEAPGIILEQSTLEERRRVAGWVRSAMPTGDSWSHNYHRQVLGRFLLELEQDELDDEAFLRICREANRWQDLVARLLTLQRVDEATDVARSVGDYDLLQLADIFVKHGQADLATELMRTRAKTSQDTRLPEWLKQRATERGDSNEALAWTQQLFWQHPSLEGYEQMKAVSKTLGTWETLQIEILARLSKQNQHALLTEIYLNEGQVDQALESVKRAASGMWGGHQTPLSIQVAQAAEKTRPQESVRIYQDAAQRLIKLRGRDNYATAATCLARVRKLYQHLGDEQTWQALIADIRKQNSRLRALKEELNRVGL